MERYATLPVENGVLGAIRQFLAGLLEKKLVDALLVPLELPTGENVVPTIVSRPEQVQRANPLAPVLPVNAARLVSRVTLVSSSPERLGVVLRSCELRALVELVKLKQASLDKLLLIGIDCFGTYSVNDYEKSVKESASSTEDFLNRAREGKEDPLLRKACQICEYPVPMGADLTIGLLGVDLAKGILLVAGTPEGEKVIEEMGLEEAKAGERQPAVEKLTAERARKREEVLKQVQEEVKGLDKMMATLATCINCHNCKTACPLCYCKECFFDSPVFEFEAEKYLGWAKRKGALRMPNDTLLFHLTRLNHMVVACVGCGLCTEACPNDVPVFDIFRLVGYEVQKVFDYVPGRSLDEELPLTTFREEELPNIGV
ncbi:MAG TPA: formate dehydrogenase [Dehalococcoidia bacterium]|nr:formate dehydrogenase [Dehalococcoidia bacterium]